VSACLPLIVNVSRNGSLDAAKDGCRKGRPGTIINRGFVARFLPALFAYYAAGLGAVAGSNYGTLRSIFLNTKIFEYDKETPIVTWLYPGVVLEQRLGRMLPGMDRHHTPLSDYLQAALRESLKPVVADDREYQEAFDRFEYLLALVYTDQKKKSGWRQSGALAGATRAASCQRSTVRSTSWA